MDGELNYRTIYMVLFAFGFITFFFFGEEKMLLPTWGTSLTVLGLFIMATGAVWESWKKKGPLVITPLGIEKGSSEGFNPGGDKINAIQTGKPTLGHSIVLL